MTKLMWVMSVYTGCSTVEHKATTIRWAQRVLTSQEMEWFLFTISKQEGFDLVLHTYRSAS